MVREIAIAEVNLVFSRGRSFAYGNSGRIMTTHQIQGVFPAGDNCGRPALRDKEAR
jgi:hypothetical protein